MTPSVQLNTTDKHLGRIVSELLEKAGTNVMVDGRGENPISESTLYSLNGNVYRGEQAIIRYALSQSGSR